MTSKKLTDIANKTDTELVKLALVNQDDFLFLMKKYEKKLLAYISRITNMSLEDREDILQEVFIKVYRNLNDFDESLKFSSWIYRITHNHVISIYRKLKARPQLTELEDKNLAHSFLEGLPIQDNIDRSLEIVKINKVLVKLDKKYSEVLILKYLEQKDYKEISDILKKPLGTVSALINRAKKNFIKETQKQKIIF